MIKHLPIAKISVDAGLQIRTTINLEVVGEYKDAQRSGATFPPLIVFDVGGKFILADGFHRLEAAKLAGVKQLSCDVRKGERDDALRFALSANAAHGLRRTNADKRRSVELALAEWPDRSDRALAELCAVSFALVADVRQASQVQESCTSNSKIPSKSQVSAPPPSRTGRDGKNYPVPPRPSSPAAPSRSAKPPERQDATGIEVPPESLGLWDSAFESAQKLLTFASEIRSEIRRAQDTNDPIFREVDHTDILAKLDMVYVDLKRAKPYAVCTDCNGVKPKGCTGCRGRGFVSEFYWKKFIPAETKKITGREELEAD